MTNRPIAMTLPTAKRVQELVRQSPSPKVGFGGKGGVRQVSHVRVTGLVQGMDRVYTGMPTVYRPDEDTWEEFDECIVSDANGDCLDIGKRYGAVRYGILEVSGTTYRYFKTLGCSCAVCSSSGSGSGSGSSSSSGGGGNTFCVLDDVWCESGGVSGNQKSISGYITIGGTRYAVTFVEGSDCGSASGSSGA